MKGFIDWIDGKLSLYVFEKKDSQYILTDTLSTRFEGELDQSSLTSLVKSGIEHIYLSVPVSLLSMRELNFPFSDKSKIKDTINFELEGILLGNTVDYSIDYSITDSSENSTRVLAACMEKTKLRDVVDLFSSVGLEPVVITSLALRLSNGNIEKLLESPSDAEETRKAAAEEEIVSPSINLRQDDLAYKGDIDRIKKSLRFTGVLILLLMLLFGSITAIKLVSTKKDNTLIKKEMNILFHDVFPEEKKIVDVQRQFKGNIKSLMAKNKILGGMPVLDILLDIASLKHANITLNELNVGSENISVKGTALSFENVDEFKKALSSSFAGVKVIDSKSSPDKKISFSIIMESMTHEEEKT